MTDTSKVPAMQTNISGSGKPLILCPGALTGWLSWMPHAEILSSSRKVIRLQVHNVALGLSGETLPDDYSLTYEVASLRETLDELEIQDADFAAWSYGAAILLSYAIHNPSRVRSLTLIEPPAFWVIRSRRELSQATLEEQKFTQALATEHISEDQLAEFAHFTGLVPKEVDPRTIAPWEGWAKHRQSLRIGDAPFQHEDNIELVRSFEKPVLLVKGEGSSAFSHDIIDILAEEFPNARVVSFPRGHAPHIVSMQAFMDEFQKFLPS